MIARRFDNIQEIGRGGMGIVYRATDTTTGEVVAIKKLSATTATPDMISRFKREGQALRDLNHPNIVRLLDVIDENDQYFLVMEYMAGGSLRDLLNKTPQLPFNQILNISLDIADALTRSHRLNIIHRDLKPANILLAENGTPRLADFGIAQIGEIVHADQSRSIVGTFQYISPEIFQGHPPDTRSDIWSFGIMLFELLAGQRPFKGDSPTKLAFEIIREPIPDLEMLCPTAPTALIDLIYRMLAKNPVERIPSVRLVGTELEALLQGRKSTSSKTVAPDGADTVIIEGRFATSTTASGESIKHNLPAQLTPFVGREAELHELRQTLHETRLVTIVASGGMGKTRLALEVANQHLEAFRHGVYFIELAPIEKSENIVSTIASAVDFQFYQSPDTPHQQLLKYFRQKEMLLIMDNFEHLLDGSDIVNEILSIAPAVKILATSRERLNLQGEVVFRITGMDFPEWETSKDALEYSAVKLFMQSARRVRPEFELHADNLNYLARICYLVQGIPLGILLAAAWVDMLSLQEISEEITRSLDFLETEIRDIPERHRSMRAVFESSWHTLNNAEQTVLMKLSVFRGGFTRSAAQKIANANLRILTTLVNKSFLQRDVSSGRYTIHELLRQYAATALDIGGETDSVNDIHSHYYLTAMQDRLPALRNHRQIETLREIHRDFENIRKAWEWARAQQNIQMLSDVAESLWQYLILSDLWTGDNRLFTNLDQHFQVHELTERERIAYGKLVFFQSFFETNEEKQSHLIQTSYDLLQGCEDRQEIGRVFTRLGKNQEEIKHNRQKALAIFEETKDLWGVGQALYDLGVICHHLLDHEAAEAYYGQSLKIARQQGNYYQQIRTLLGLSRVAFGIKPYEHVQEFLEEALHIARQNGFKRYVGICLNHLASVLSLIEQYNQAEDYAQQAIEIAQQVGDDMSYSASLDTFATIKYSSGLFSEALVMYQESLALATQNQWLRLIQFANKQIGFTYLGLRDLPNAQTYLTQCLRASQKYAFRGLLIESLIGIARLFMLTDRKVRALELLTFTASNPVVDKHDVDEIRWLEQLETELSIDTVQAAKEHALTFELEQLVAEILEELKI